MKIRIGRGRWLAVTAHWAATSTEFPKYLQVERYTVALLYFNPRRLMSDSFNINRFQCPLRLIFFFRQEGSLDMLI